MKKQLVLDALLRMRDTYAYSLQFNPESHNDFGDFLQFLNVQDGMCFYVKYLHPSLYLPIFRELKKEQLKFYSRGYWYKAPCEFWCENNEQEKITNECLKPRLEHLNRTIARLEAELQSQPLNKEHE